MSPRFSLAHLSLMECSIPELVYIAARAGFDAVGPRLIPMGTADESAHLQLDRNSRNAIRMALQQTGIAVDVIELCRIDANFSCEKINLALEVGAELQAQYLITSVWVDKPWQKSFVVDSFAALCQAARGFGLQVRLEFPTFSAITTLAEAKAVVHEAAQANGGILLDTIYIHMSKLDFAELDQLPPDWLGFIHLADIPAQQQYSIEEMLQLARSNRLYPGEGCIDFPRLLNHLPELNYSVEIPNKKKVADIGYEEHARRCLVSARQTVTNFKKNKDRGVYNDNRLTRLSVDRPAHSASTTSYGAD